jgi:hypothetical protein
MEIDAEVRAGGGLGPADIRYMTSFSDGVGASAATHFNNILLPGSSLRPEDSVGSFACVPNLDMLSQLTYSGPGALVAARSADPLLAGSSLGGMGMFGLGGTGSASSLAAGDAVSTSMAAPAPLSGSRSMRSVGLGRSMSRTASELDYDDAGTGVGAVRPRTNSHIQEDGSGQPPLKRARTQQSGAAPNGTGSRK